MSWGPSLSSGPGGENGAARGLSTGQVVAGPFRSPRSTT